MRPGCDPLSQKRLTDGVEACGSTHVATGSGSGSTGPEQGCYTADFVAFTCASTPEGRGNTADLTDRQACTAANGCAFDSTHFFTNGCEPGFVSFFFDSTGSSQIDCTRLCAPLEADVTKPANGVGDGSALGKLPTDTTAVANHAACKVNLGAKETGEECRFIWPFLLDPNTGAPSTSAYNDTLGVCFAFKNFMYDPTGGSNATKIEPSCGVLRAGSGSDITGPANVACSNPGTGSEADCYAVAHQCYKLADSMFAGPKVANGRQVAAKYHAWLGDPAKLRRVGGIR